MLDFRRTVEKIVDGLVAASFLIFALLLAALLLLLSARLVDNALLTQAATFLNYFSLMLSMASLFSSFYQRRQRQRHSSELRAVLNSDVSSIAKTMETTFRAFIPGYGGLPEQTIVITESRFWTEFQNKGIIDSDLEYSIIDYLCAKIADDLSLSRGRKMFLVHQYLSRHQIDMLPRFLNTLNKGNFTIEGTDENQYARLLALYNVNPSETLVELMQKLKSVPNEDVRAIAIQAQGQQGIVEEIVENAKEDKDRLSNLKRIVQRIVLEGYISEKGLASLMQKRDDLCIVIKSEAGVSSLKTVFQKAKEVTPFKKILLKHGFIKASGASPGTFIIPANKLPDEYKDNVSGFIQEAVVPEVEAEWKDLQSRYNFKRLQNVTYSYITFTIKRDQLSWNSLNTRLRREVEEMLVSLSLQETAQAIASHLYEIPSILKKMEMDALADSGTANMKLAMRNAESAIREDLAKQDIIIRDVSAYRAVEPVLLADSIKKLANPELDKLAPKARHKFTDDTALRIAQEICKNANDLHSLVQGLGVKI
jgi:hypothetical protein